METAITILLFTICLQFAEKITHSTQYAFLFVFGYVIIGCTIILLIDLMYEILYMIY